MTAPHGAAAAGEWSERIKGAAEVVAPLTLLTALLYYFGYVSSYSHFAYFGIDLSTLGMSTQDLVLRSVAALYIPLLVLLAAALASYVLHGAVRDVLASGARRTLSFWAGVVTCVVGVLLLLRAAYGIAVPVVAETELPAATPLCLGLGALSCGYGAHVATVARRPAGGAPSATEVRVNRAVTVAIGGAVVLSLFWATNSFAGAYGRGQAAVDSTRLAERPSVVLDTKERLYLRFPGVEETALPEADGQEFRFRYRGLRLLIEANGKLFVIPERWRDGGGVLVVPHDGSSRAQFEPGRREGT